MFRSTQLSLPRLENRAALGRIREALVSNGYGASNLHRVLPDASLDAYLDGWSGPARYQSEGRTGLETLARLFLLGFDVAVSDLAVFRPAELRDWVASRLVRLHRGRVYPQVAIQAIPRDGIDVFVASDVSRPDNSRPADSVTAIGTGTTLLTQLIPRRRAERALDLGTGTGILALVVADWHTTVVGTDINPRAVEFARFNAALNDVSNAEFRTADLYRGLEDEQFDLIVSNPPYVVSPSTRQLSRDSPLPGDQLSAEVVRGAARHLRADGWALVSCDWVTRDNEDDDQRIRSWVAGEGCDLLVLRMQHREPAEYALAWLKDVGKVRPKDADRQFAEWMEYYGALGITGLDSGVLVLRKARGHPPWFATEELSDEASATWSEALVAAFEARNWLQAAAAQGSVLDRRLKLAESVKVEPNRQRVGDRWIEDGVVLILTLGLNPRMQLSGGAADVVLACEHGASVGEVLNHSLNQRRVPLSTANPTFVRVRNEVEGLTRQLVLRGFLVPVDD